MVGEENSWVGQESPVILLLITESGHSHVHLPPWGALFFWRSPPYLTVYQRASTPARPFLPFVRKGDNLRGCHSAELGRSQYVEGFADLISFNPLGGGVGVLTQICLTSKLPVSGPVRTVIYSLRKESCGEASPCLAVHLLSYPPPQPLLF